MRQCIKMSWCLGLARLFPIKIWQARISLNKFIFSICFRSVFVQILVIIWLSPFDPYFLCERRIFFGHCDKCKVCATDHDHIEYQKFLHLFLYLIIFCHFCCNANTGEREKEREKNMITTHIVVAIAVDVAGNDVKLKMHSVLLLLGCIFRAFKMREWRKNQQQQQKQIVISGANEYTRATLSLISKYRSIFFLAHDPWHCRHRRHCGRVFFHFAFGSYFSRYLSFSLPFFASLNEKSTIVRFFRFSLFHYIYIFYCSFRYKNIFVFDLRRVNIHTQNTFCLFFFSLSSPVWPFTTPFLMFRFNVIHRSSHRFLVLIFNTRLSVVERPSLFLYVLFCRSVFLATFRSLFTMKVIGKIICEKHNFFLHPFGPQHAMYYNVFLFIRLHTHTHSVK